jgi:hypothetical protein
VKPSPGRIAAASAVYSLAALLLTWPLAINLTSRLGALEGVGDPFLNLWILGWGLHAWVGDPVSVLTGRVFDANIFHPAQGALTFSDHFLLQALALSPVYAATGDAVLCYNLVVIASIALSGLAMHLLARSVTGSTFAAYAAGLAWAMWPYRTAHLFHLQLQALYFLPLALFFLHRVMAGRRLADAAALGLMAGLQAITSVYYGVMTAVTLVVAAVVLAVTSGQWRSRRLLACLGLAAGVGVLAALPFMVPYLRTQQIYGFGRNLYEAANNAAGLPSYTQVSPHNALYGRTGLLSPQPPSPGERDRSSAEHQMFPGFTLIALGVLGVWRGWRSDRRPTTATALTVMVTGVVLSLGPEGVRTLYAALHSWVFGFEAIRAPVRFGVIAMAGLAILGAVGFAWLESRQPAGTRGRRAVLPVLLAILAAEYVNEPLPLAPAPPRVTPTGQWLRATAGPGAVLHLPIPAVDAHNTHFMVQSLEHWRPIVNGYSGQRPPFYTALLESLSEFPSMDAFVMLREIDVRFVVSREPIDGANTPESPLAHRATLADGVVYELVWTPAAEAALNETAFDTPPPPGPLPFRPGERLTYEISWDGGPLELPAGTATLEAMSAEGQPLATASRAEWTFDVTARTADWVSAFFEARDRFATATDAALKPLAHVREIREGRRQFDRTFFFDPQARVVRMGPTPEAAGGAGAVTLPVPPDVRDAISTFYYVRTLTLEEGDVLTLPVNDGGRNMMLRLRVGGTETVMHQGRPTTALRLEPRVVRRVERRQPLSLTIWMSADERRVPLVADVAAGFGRVRANLVDYRP